MECLSHPDRGRVAQRSGIVVTSRSSRRPLEERRLLAPVVALYPLAGTFTAAATPTNATWGRSRSGRHAAGARRPAAPITSVSELTPISSFGGDIVGSGRARRRLRQRRVRDLPRRGRQRARRGQPPGRDLPRRPGDRQGERLLRPQHGPQPDRLDNTTPAHPAANSVGTSTGLVNWYDITFDPEGYFDGTPVDVRQQRRSVRPEQEHHLPDRAQTAR